MKIAIHLKKIRREKNKIRFVYSLHKIYFNVILDLEEDIAREGGGPNSNTFLILGGGGGVHFIKHDSSWVYMVFGCMGH